MVALVAMVTEPLGQLGEVLAQEGRRAERKRGQEENQVWEEGQQCQRLLGGPRGGRWMVSLAFVVLE